MEKSSILNWDKQSVAAVVIGALVLVGWFIYGPALTGDQESQVAPEEVKTEESAENKSADTKSEPAQTPAEKSAVAER